MELDSIETERKRKRATVHILFTLPQPITSSWLKRRACLPNNKTAVESWQPSCEQPNLVSLFYFLPFCFHAIDGELEHAGVCGRLGDLGEIDSYYDVAASTASSALDYIVVETGEGAQKCVEYLKKYNAGRSRFLILEEMQ